MITIQVDTREATRWLTDLQRKQIPFAISVALNETAKDVQKEVTKGMSVFDRPRAQTVKGTYIRRSTKRNLVAEIGLKSRQAGSIPVAEYLEANMAQGGRVDKRSETLLKNAGILPQGKQTRPGPDARLDAYGNMSRGQIVQIISFFRAFGSVQTSGRGLNQPTRSSKLNAPKQRKTALKLFVTPLGIFERRGRNVLWLITFTDAQAYPKIYDFQQIGLSKVERQWQDNFTKALNYALFTAR